MSDFMNYQKICKQIEKTEIRTAKKQEKMIKQLQQERDLYKEVIEEVREIIEKGLDFDNPYYADKCEEELLQILDKAKENK